MRGLDERLPGGKSAFLNAFKGFFCARNEIRTRTSLRMPPPQDGASTNFATRAFTLQSLKYGVYIITITSNLRL